MAKFVDFPIVYGKLGNHPGFLTTDAALKLYTIAMQCRQGATFLDNWPEGGRSTVLLATVARNLDGKVKVICRWDTAPQNAALYFERAYKTHKLADVAQVYDYGTDKNGIGAYDLAVVRGDVLPLVNGDLNAAEKIFVYAVRDQVNVDDFVTRESGQGWALLERR